MPDETKNPVAQSARKAREASRLLAGLSADTRNAALEAMAAACERRKDEILAANQKDIEAAETLVQSGKITAAAAKRLKLAGSKFDGVVEGLRAVAALPDPLGRVQVKRELDEKLILERVSCPIGVIAMIFESRPDALPQIASLCLKSGNAVLLKGGSEARHSNRILADVLYEASLEVEGVPEGWLALLETREEIAQILGLDEYIDLIVPRGSNEFVQYIMNNTKIPVTGHRDGICHVYVHEKADLDKAISLVLDAKTQYPAVCNAAETLLVDRNAPKHFLPLIACALMEEGVTIKAEEDGRALMMEHANSPHCSKGRKHCVLPGNIEDAFEDDWSTEYLDLVLSVRLVDGIDKAIAHINKYGSHHTDAIVTEDAGAAGRFIAGVDSASVLHNASTRFADGFRYGLGAEIGISTEKIHSRGPVGLEGLTIYKYVLQGDGHVVADYSGENARKFTHKDLPPQ